MSAASLYTAAGAFYHAVWKIIQACSSRTSGSRQLLQCILEVLDGWLLLLRPRDVDRRQRGRFDGLAMSPMASDYRQRQQRDGMRFQPQGSRKNRDSKPMLQRTTRHVDLHETRGSTEFASFRKLRQPAPKSEVIFVLMIYRSAGVSSVQHVVADIAGGGSCGSGHAIRLQTTK